MCVPHMEGRSQRLWLVHQTSRPILQFRKRIAPVLSLVAWQKPWYLECHKSNKGTNELLNKTQSTGTKKAAQNHFSNQTSGTDCSLARVSPSLLHSVLDNVRLVTVKARQSPSRLKAQHPAAWKSPEHPCFRKDGAARQCVKCSDFLKTSMCNCPEVQLSFT